MLGQKPASKESVARLEAMLNDQQTKIHEKQDQSFLARRDMEYSQSQDRAYPRTFENKQFFTPHLQRSKQPEDDPVVREYVMVLGNGMIVRQSQKSRTIPLEQDPPTLPPIARDRIRELESQGWLVTGHNADMVEMERLYNPQTQARDATMRAAKKYAIGVISLTIAIYVGQFFWD